MDVKLHADLKSNLLAREAATAVEACVHCGFCLATCPTYLDSRDERDSPRGRIYLIKDLLESNHSDSVAQHHIDRCLTCRSCETTCPSGVEYGVIADAGRALIAERVPRAFPDRLMRRLLLLIVPYRKRFAPLLKLGQVFKFLLPRSLAAAIPAAQAVISLPVRGSTESTKRRVILLEGCVQSAATPNTNRAARRVLAQLSIGVSETPAQGCCGALATHLGELPAGKDAMRRNIDAWWPAVEDGAEAIISTATGCGSQLADYARALADDPDYAERARRVSALSQDLASYIGEHLQLLPGGDSMEQTGSAPSATKAGSSPRVAVHIPCSQSHALGDADSVRRVLAHLGFMLAGTRDDHLCCGSAGSYSLLQPAMSGRLRERKLNALTADKPDLIVSANIGCQLHLAQNSEVPVRHWVELVCDRLGDVQNHAS